VLCYVYARECEPPGIEPPPCDPASCLLPNCACETSEPDIPLAERPQIVYLTFDDAFTALSESTYYRELFNGTFVNPDGCAIRATHFVSARSNDYSLVNQYFYEKGHAVAVHSITHRSPPDYFKGLNQSEWTAEMGGMKTMLTNFAELPPEEIRGTRAPFLQGGGDVQFDMMEDLGFEFDSSMPTQENGYLYMEYGRWPYTLDYKVNELKQACQVEPCPVCSHPGIWTQPMLDLEDNLPGPDGNGYPCAMLDSCLGTETADDVYQMLKRNFDRGYNGFTRAPFGLYVHAAWFFGYDYRFEGYKTFLDYITTMDDVWVVPIHAGLQYRRTPVTNAELLNGSLPIFHCDNFPTPPQPCRPKSCPYEDVYYPEDGIDGEEYIKVCGYCPENYPWLHNPEGN